MPDLLVDISQAALASGITNELFEPQVEITKDFYAEKPISLRMVGSYHQFGDFSSAIRGVLAARRDPDHARHLAEGERSRCECARRAIDP